MNNKKICGLLGLATRAGKIVFGTEATITAINKNKVNLILISEEAAERTKINFKEICEKNNIPMRIVLKTEELSNSIGKENKVVVGITDINFSKEMIKIINGGEVIG